MVGNLKQLSTVVLILKNSDHNRPDVLRIFHVLISNQKILLLSLPCSGFKVFRGVCTEIQAT